VRQRALNADRRQSLARKGVHGLSGEEARQSGAFQRLAAAWRVVAAQRTVRVPEEQAARVVWVGRQAEDWELYVKLELGAPVACLGEAQQERLQVCCEAQSTSNTSLSFAPHLPRASRQGGRVIRMLGAPTRARVSLSLRASDVWHARSTSHLASILGVNSVDSVDM
jgi:hypothetical protein